MLLHWTIFCCFQIYNQSQYSKRSIHKALLDGGGGKLHMYPHSSRMVPLGLDPACHKMYISVIDKYVAGGGRQKKKKRNSIAEAFKKTSAATTAAQTTSKFWFEHTSGIKYTEEDLVRLKVRHYPLQNIKSYYKQSLNPFRKELKSHLFTKHY